MNNDEEKSPVPGRAQRSSKVSLITENADRCLCPGCPTYNSSDCPDKKEERIFCSIGKTECDLEKRGCICGDCPVFKEQDLKVGYFCVKGEADETGNPVSAEEYSTE